MIRFATLIVVLAALTACGNPKAKTPEWLPGKWGAQVEEGKVEGSAMMLEVEEGGKFSAKFLQRFDTSIDLQAIFKGSWKWEPGKLILTGEITQQAAGMPGQPARPVSHQKGQIVWVLLADETSKSLRPAQREFPKAAVPGVITLSSKLNLQKTEF